jgi:hypothetical protein
MATEPAPDAAKLVNRIDRMMNDPKWTEPIDDLLRDLRARLLAAPVAQGAVAESACGLAHPHCPYFRVPAQPEENEEKLRGDAELLDGEPITLRRLLGWMELPLAAAIASSGPRLAAAGEPRGNVTVEWRTSRETVEALLRVLAAPVAQEDDFHRVPPLAIQNEIAALFKSVERAQIDQRCASYNEAISDAINVVNRLLAAQPEEKQP